MQRELSVHNGVAKKKDSVANYTDFCIVADMKKLLFAGSSLDDLREFPSGARREAGHQLMQVQNGGDPDDWKPLSSIGSGVREIRIHHEGAFRVIYWLNLGTGSV